MEPQEPMWELDGKKSNSLYELLRGAPELKKYHQKQPQERKPLPYLDPNK